MTDEDQYAMCVYRGGNVFASGWDWDAEIIFGEDVGSGRGKVFIAFDLVSGPDLR